MKLKYKKPARYEVPRKPFEIASLEKTSDNHYHIRFKYDQVDGGGGGWAIFMIDNDLGTVSAITDWGNYSYRWPISGMAMKDGNRRETLQEFLSDIDSGYAFTKFIGDPKHFDSEITKEQLLQDIIRFRRTFELSESEARLCWEEVIDFNGDNISVDTYMWTFEDFHPNTYARVYGGDLYDIPRHMDYSYWEQIFVYRIFTAFQQILREELKNEI